MANGYAQNIGAPASLLGSFDAAVKIRRNIEEVRNMMQAREDMRAAREAMAAANEQIAQVSGQAMESSAEMKQLLRDMAAGKKVSPEQLRATTTLYQMDALELGNRKNQIYTNLLGPLMHNAEAVRMIGGAIQQNNEAISKFGAFLQGGFEQQAMTERTERTAEATEYAARVGAEATRYAADVRARKDRMDPMQATLDAQQFVSQATDPEEMKKLAELGNMTESELMRGAVGYIATQIMQGEIPNLDGYLQPFYERQAAVDAPLTEAEKTEQRRAAVGGVARGIAGGFAEKGRQVMGLARKIGEAGQQYRPKSGPDPDTLREHSRGWGASRGEQ